MFIIRVEVFIIVLPARFDRKGQNFPNVQTLRYPVFNLQTCEFQCLTFHQLAKRCFKQNMSLALY